MALKRDKTMIEKLTKVASGAMAWKDEKDYHWESKLAYLQTEIMGFVDVATPMK
jgi:hypothetical protein